MLREVTERPEAVEAGAAKLVGVDPVRLFNEVVELMDNHENCQLMAKAVNLYGDGKAAKRIVQTIEYFFGFSQSAPSEFMYRDDAPAP